MHQLIIRRKSGIDAGKRSFLGNTITTWPVIGPNEARHCTVAFFELDPGNTANAYHYHETNEEVFYILQGTGVVQSVDGDLPVGSGDVIFCPATPEGAHLLKNTAECEKLVYLNVSTNLIPDIMYTPDSGGGVLFTKRGNHPFSSEP